MRNAAAAAIALLATALASRAPTSHRVASATCDANPRPSSALRPGLKDSDCTAGKNGRWGAGAMTMTGPKLECQYDQCFQDADCGKSGVCACGTDSVHRCITNGNCRVDGDCGANGFCSPSATFSCPNWTPLAGYYCHTARDECIDDGDCHADAGRGSSRGTCVFDPGFGAWTCTYQFCVN